jgi:hypothetical protein
MSGFYLPIAFELSVRSHKLKEFAGAAFDVLSMNLLSLLLFEL